jgi:hypothetical protein
MAFMPGHDIDLVALDLSTQRHRLFFATTPSRNCVAMTCTSSSFNSNSAAICLLDKFKPHQIQAQDPRFQALAMPLKDGPTQIVELSTTRLALIPLSMGLVVVKAPLVDLPTASSWTDHPLRPAQLSHHFIAFGIVHKSLNIQQHLYFCLYGLIAPILPSFPSPPCYPG